MHHEKLLIARAVVTPLANRAPMRIVNTSVVVELSFHECQDTVCNLKEVTLSDPLPSDLTAAQRENFLALISLYLDVLVINANDLGHAKIMNHHIDTNGAQQIHHQARWVPLPYHEKVHELLQDMFQK